MSGRRRLRAPDPVATTTGIGLISVAAGTALIAAPSRMGPAMGLGDHPAVAQAIGAADVALVPGLLRGRPRWPWLLGRMAVNLAVAARYLTLIRPGAGGAGAVAGAAGRLALTVGDSTVMLRLRAQESEAAA